MYGYGSYYISLLSLYISVHEQYARTEKIKNNENPQFMKSVEITYYFEVIQKLRFVVYDIDNETATLADDECLGSMECSLGEVWKIRSYVCACVGASVHVCVYISSMLTGLFGNLLYMLYGSGN